MADGILLLNKPKGMTSHDCVNRVRRLLHTKKVGHTGTLDPSVTGVLPICVNDATKIIQFMVFDTKEYIAEISLSTLTSTQDAEGDVLERDDSYKTVTQADLLACLETFKGKLKQLPPMVSAVRVGGKRLYEYARQNIEVERTPRDVEVLELELLEPRDVYEGHEIVFKIRAYVSKGTYIRTLAVDIGNRLGYPAHLKQLVRTISGKYPLEQCVSFEDVEAGRYELVSLYEALSHRYMVEVDEDMLMRIMNGQKLENIYQEDEIVFVDDAKNVYAVYQVDPSDQSLIKPMRVFITKG